MTASTELSDYIADNYGACGIEPRCICRQPDRPWLGRGCPHWRSCGAPDWAALRRMAGGST